MTDLNKLAATAERLDIPKTLGVLRFLQAELGPAPTSAAVVKHAADELERLYLALHAIRRALQHPINRAAIVDTVWGNDTETLVDSINATLGADE